jgi:tRNA threonylcarbamoyladenosine biosynthesis protein TsaB
LAEAEAVELCLDTAGPVASVAVARCGVLLAELTWRTRAGHEVELLPAIDAALQRAGVEREAIAAIFVDRGPGGYAGLRVGASVAMGIALALDAALLGRCARCIRRGAAISPGPSTKAKAMRAAS